MIYTTNINNINNIIHYNQLKKKYIIINDFLICLNDLSIEITTLNDIIINLQTIIKNQNLYKNSINVKNSYKNINFNKNNYFIIHNSKLYNKYTTINKLYEISNTILYFNAINRQYGGGFFGMLEGIIKIGKFFLLIGKIFEWFGKMIYWTLLFIAWLFYDLLNPVKFASSFLDSLLAILISLCRIPFDIFMALFAFSSNMIAGWLQGVWGWDQSSLTKKDRDSNYFQNINRSKGKKCYLTKSNTVPFSIIIGTILCPPVGVFMELGLTGWLNILVCCMLTLFFYLPGLVYALLIVFS
jgi:uncharacterized membrane protein YqaE (UPF0057 family)